MTLLSLFGVKPKEEVEMVPVMTENTTEQDAEDVKNSEEDKEEDGEQTRNDEVQDAVAALVLVVELTFKETTGAGRVHELLYLGVAAIFYGQIGLGASLGSGLVEDGLYAVGLHVHLQCLRALVGHDAFGIAIVHEVLEFAI